MLTERISIIYNLQVNLNNYLLKILSLLHIFIILVKLVYIHGKHPYQLFFSKLLIFST